MSEAVLITICLSRCIMTASPVLLWTMFPVMWDWRRWRGAGLKEQREMMWDNRYRETEMEFVRQFSVLYLLKKMWRGKSVEQHKAVCHTSNTSPGTKKSWAKGHFSFTWAEEVYGLGISLWFRLRKLVRYWSLHHVISLTLLVKAFCLSPERWDKNTQTHTCTHPQYFWFSLWAKL